MLDYLEINTGDTVKFPGTVGRHTVHGVRDMIPEGVKKISIMPRQPNEVTFDKPGVYRINCKLHQRHGMVPLLLLVKTYIICKKPEKASNGLARIAVIKCTRFWIGLKNVLEKKNSYKFLLSKRFWVLLL